MIKKNNYLFVLVVCACVCYVLLLSQNSKSAMNDEYTNSTYGFSLETPSNYTIIRQEEGFVQLVSNSSLDHLDHEFSSIMFIIRDNSEGHQLSKWFEKKSKYYIGDRKFEDVKNSGFKSKIFNGKESYSVSYEGMGDLESTVFLLTNGNVLEITAHSLGGFDKEQNVYQAYEFILNKIEIENKEI
jgi:hypothetical protein